MSAWVALSDRAIDQAVTVMRQAADGEDASIKHVAMENRLYPMRELLADLLLEAGRAKEAATEYARALKQTPNRYRGLFGAARAAEAIGDATAARGYYARVIELVTTRRRCSPGAAARPGVSRAPVRRIEHATFATCAGGGEIGSNYCCVGRAAQGYGSDIFTPLASKSISTMRCHDAVLVLRP